MSKKPTKKKAGARKALKKKATFPRKGGKRPYKSHTSTGVGRSLALAKKAKREREAKNAAASAKALKKATKKKATAKKKFDATVTSAGVIDLTVAAPTAASASPAAAPKKKRKGKKAASAAPAAKKTSKKAGKRRGKKGGKKAGKKRAKQVAAAPQAAPKKKRRTIGNLSKSRKSATPKFALMHKWGFPSRRPMTAPKRKELRSAAGGFVTAKQILDTINAEKLKSWVCVGPRRTGCGGGSKNLRGGHQVGRFISGHGG